MNTKRNINAQSQAHSKSADEFSASSQLTLIRLKGKVRKIVADAVRSAIKNEHGYSATKGRTDESLSKAWGVILRFKTKANRDSFYDYLREVLHPEIFKLIKIKKTRPPVGTTSPVRILYS